MIDKEEIGRNIKELLKGFADSSTDIEITIKSGKEADVFLDGKKFNTYLIEEKCFLHNIPKPVNNQEAFFISVVISRDDLAEKHTMYKGAELQLPASVNELKDGFQRARITNDIQPYSITECTFYNDNIADKLDANSVTLPKLNYLAKVMSGFTSYEHALFRGCMAENEIIDIDDLINAAYNLDSCNIIDDLKNDEQLGKIYTDNAWLPWCESVSSEVWKYIDYQKLGSDIRKKEGGIYTKDGYFVNSKENYKRVYNGAEFPEVFEEDEYIFKLHIARKPESYESKEKSEAWLTLPASKERKMRLLSSIDTETLEDCILIAVQSMESNIPMCVTDISQAGLLNDLAHRMRDMDRRGTLSKFKALLSVTLIEKLEDAIKISDELDEFELFPEASSDIEYAKEVFDKEFRDMIPEKLLPHFNFATYSKALNDESNIAVTEYGVVLRKKGTAIQNGDS